jgi:hypothetical protein
MCRTWSRATKNVPVGDMIDAIITGTIIDLEKAIAARDFGMFSADFDKLTEACNSCHQAANRGFIIVKRPAQSNFSNQDFTPARPARCKLAFTPLQLNTLTPQLYSFTA